MALTAASVNFEDLAYNSVKLVHFATKAEIPVSVRVGISLILRLVSLASVVRHLIPSFLRSHEKV
jgi:hypothetical protein